MIQMPTNWLADPIGYQRQLTIYNNQIHQDQTNKTAHDNYVTDYNSWMSRNEQYQAYGKSIDPPLVMPMYKTFNDDGSVTETNFPDLKPTVMLPNPSTSNMTGAVPKGTPPQLTIDQKLDMIITLLTMPKVGG